MKTEAAATGTAPNDLPGSGTNLFVSPGTMMDMKHMEFQIQRVGKIRHHFKQSQGVSPSAHGQAQAPGTPGQAFGSHPAVGLMSEGRPGVFHCPHARYEIISCQITGQERFLGLSGIFPRGLMKERGPCVFC